MGYQQAIMRPMPAWNNWFHCNGNTYGTWVRGDPRGWRSRKHHEHVDGHYKKPPPKGKYKRQYEQSKRLMKRKEVELPLDAREIACRMMVESLLFRGVEVIALSVGKRHWHALTRFVPLDPKKSRAIAIAGFAKNRSPRFLIGIERSARREPSAKSGSSIKAVSGRESAPSNRLRIVNTS
jgi:hypothetical protein